MTDLKSLANSVLSRNKAVPRGLGQHGGNGTPMGQPPTSHVRVLVLLPELYADEPDNADPAEGRRIIEAVKAAGGWISIERGKIVLRWRGDFSGGLIDRIREARTAVVHAMRPSTRQGTRP